MDGETVINDDLSSFCPISYPITRQTDRRLPISSSIPSANLFPSFFPSFSNHVSLFLSLSLSLSIRRSTVKEERLWSIDIILEALVRSFFNVNRTDACSSMEIQLCTRHRGEVTAGPWQPWPRLSGPNVHPCTRGISLDSRRSTSPAKMDTTKAAASSCWPVAIPTFKTTWVIGQLSFLPFFLPPPFPPLSFSFVSRFPLSRNSPFRTFYFNRRYKYDRLGRQSTFITPRFAFLTLSRDEGERFGKYSWIFSTGIRRCTRLRGTGTQVLRGSWSPPFAACPIKTR